MGQKTSERWDFVLIKTSQSQTVFLDVVEGQTITVQWETPTDITQNQNGWVINGNGCCNNITKVRIVGENGTQTLSIITSGHIRVGGYMDSDTFNLVAGSIVRIRFE